MNKLRSDRIAAWIFAFVAIALAVVGIYGMTRPVSCESSYYHASFFEGESLNGTIIFYSDNTMVVDNTNFDEEMTFLSYYKDGYVFFPLGEPPGRMRKRSSNSQ